MNQKLGNGKELLEITVNVNLKRNDLQVIFFK